MNQKPPPPQQMFQMITGYWVSQLVGALAELGVVDDLAARPRTSAELAREKGCEPHAIERVLRAATAIGVTTRDEQGRFSPTQLGDTLRSDVPGSMRDMAIAQTSPGHWMPWGRFREAVRTGTRQTPAALGMEIFEHYAKAPREAAAFSGAMKNLAALVASEVARVIETSGKKRVVDVGGANGTLLAAVLAANPQLSGVLLDLPHVADGARAALDGASVGARCEVVSGDFLKNVPSADLYLLKQVLHDWDDEQCKTILANCAKGLAAGGSIAVVEMVIPDDLRPSPAQLMDLNMLVMLPGRERTQREYTELFASAGLELQRCIETHSPFQILVATR